MINRFSEDTKYNVNGGVDRIFVGRTEEGDCLFLVDGLSGLSIYTNDNSPVQRNWINAKYFKDLTVDEEKYAWRLFERRMKKIQREVAA